jgi:hypothetical protein
VLHQPDVRLPATDGARTLTTPVIIGDVSENCANEAAALKRIILSALDCLNHDDVRGALRVLRGSTETAAQIGCHPTALVCHPDDPHCQWPECGCKAPE